MNNNPHFEPGLYAHHKGGTYTALTLIKHHHTRQPMVVYLSHTTGEINVRSLNGWPEDPDAWNDLVETEGGELVLRFRRIKL